MDIGHYCVQNRSSLIFCTVFKDSLDHSAAIGMEAELTHCLWLFKDGFNYELHRFVWHLLDTLLNYMISILIVYAIKDGVFKFLN